MNAIAVLVIFTIALTLFGILTTTNPVFATHLTNSAFLTEGSGFAVSEESIKFSEIDFGIVSNSAAGTRINFSVDDGFFLLDTQEYDATDLNGSFLRDGKFLRVSGTAGDPDGGDQINIRLFGRLIEDSKQGSVYGFTGQVNQANVEYKVIYTVKLSKFVLEEKPTSTVKEETTTTTAQPKTIKILKGASTRSFGENYIDVYSKLSERVKAGETTVSQYFSKSRLSIKPGDMVTFINEDTVPHKILSGKENYNDRYNQYTADGRIDSGTIMPGESVTLQFDEAGFYRLFDPDYPWMNTTFYVFPGDVMEQLIRGSSKQLGN